MTTLPERYAARLTIDYPERLDRLTTLLRVIWIIPIAVVLSLLTATGNETVVRETGERVMRSTGGGISGGLVFATVVMIGFRVGCPSWWFDFARQLTRLGAGAAACVPLVRYRHPTTAWA